MTRLRPILLIHHDETLTSYVSRLAQVHMRPSARKFCGELGIDYGLLCHGKPAAIERLQEITNIPKDILYRSAVTHGNEGWLVRGERFQRTALRRTTFAYCPLCLQSDVASGNNIGTAIYERLPWTLEAITTCSRHDVALTVVSPETEIADLRDFARQIVLFRKEAPQAFERVSRRQATGLERYIEDRLCSDQTDITALGTTPLYAVIRASEVFGTADLHGTSRAPRTLSLSERTAAGGAGFAFLSRGRLGVCDVMERIRSVSSGSGSASDRPSAVYGRLHAWLYRTKDPAYGTIKDSAAEYIIGHSSSHLSGSLFGRKIVGRPWYTIRTASIAFDIDPGRLRNVMTAIGRIRPEEDALSNNRIVISATDLHQFLRDIQDCVGWNSMMAILGVPRRTVGEFVGPGFIQPLVEKGADHRLKCDLFRKSDIDDFMARLLRHATTVDTPSPGLFDFQSARRRSLARTKDIIDMLLQHRLTRVERWTGASGIPSIFIDAEEVRRIAFPQKLDGLTSKKASAFLRISFAALTALVFYGYLKFRYIGTPRERNATKVIPWSELENFRKTYVTQFELVHSLGISYSALEKLLLDFNIRTIHCAEQIGLKLYLRSDASIIME